MTCYKFYTIIFILSLSTSGYAQTPKEEFLIQKEIRQKQESLAKSVIMLLSDKKVNETIVYFDTLNIKDLRGKLVRASNILFNIRAKSYLIDQVLSPDDKNIHRFGFYDIKTDKEYFGINFTFYRSKVNSKIIGLDLPEKRKPEDIIDVDPNTIPPPPMMSK